MSNEKRDMRAIRHQRVEQTSQAQQSPKLFELLNQQQILNSYLTSNRVGDLITHMQRLLALAELNVNDLPLAFQNQFLYQILMLNSQSCIQILEQNRGLTSRLRQLDMRSQFANDPNRSVRQWFNALSQGYRHANHVLVKQLLKNWLIDLIGYIREHNAISASDKIAYLVEQYQQTDDESHKTLLKQAIKGILASQSKADRSQAADDDLAILQVFIRNKVNTEVYSQWLKNIAFAEKDYDDQELPAFDRDSAAKIITQEIKQLNQAENKSLDYFKTRARLFYLLYNPQLKSLLLNDPSLVTSVIGSLRQLPEWLYDQYRNQFYHVIHECFTHLLNNQANVRIQSNITQFLASQQGLALMVKSDATIKENNPQADTVLGALLGLPSKQTSQGGTRYAITQDPEWVARVVDLMVKHEAVDKLPGAAHLNSRYMSDLVRGCLSYLKKDGKPEIVKTILNALVDFVNHHPDQRPVLYQMFVKPLGKDGLEAANRVLVRLMQEPDQALDVVERLTQLSDDKLRQSCLDWFLKDKDNALLSQLLNEPHTAQRLLSMVYTNPVLAEYRNQRRLSYQLYKQPGIYKATINNQLQSLIVNPLQRKLNASSAAQQNNEPCQPGQTDYPAVIRYCYAPRIWRKTRDISQNVRDACQRAYQVNQHLNKKDVKGWGKEAYNVPRVSGGDIADVFKDLFHTRQTLQSASSTHAYQLAQADIDEQLRRLFRKRRLLSTQTEAINQLIHQDNAKHVDTLLETLVTDSSPQFAQQFLDMFLTKGYFNDRLGELLQHDHFKQTYAKLCRADGLFKFYQKDTRLHEIHVEHLHQKLENPDADLEDIKEILGRINTNSKWLSRRKDDLADKLVNKVQKLYEKQDFATQVPVQKFMADYQVQLQAVGIKHLPLPQHGNKPMHYKQLNQTLNNLQAQSQYYTQASDYLQQMLTNKQLREYVTVADQHPGDKLVTFYEDQPAQLLASIRDLIKPADNTSPVRLDSADNHIFTAQLLKRVIDKLDPRDLRESQCNQALKQCQQTLIDTIDEAKSPKTFYRQMEVVFAMTNALLDKTNPCSYNDYTRPLQKLVTTQFNIDPQHKKQLVDKQLNKLNDSAKWEFEAPLYKTNNAPKSPNTPHSKLKRPRSLKIKKLLKPSWFKGLPQSPTQQASNQSKENSDPYAAHTPVREKTN